MAAPKEEGECRNTSMRYIPLTLPSGFKRKATDEPTSPSLSKRVKSAQSDSPEPEDKKVATHPVPFPEKVCCSSLSGRC
jgi:hypothetical protein